MWWQFAWFKKIIESIFKDDDEKPDDIKSEKEVHKTDTYLNQLKFRSIHNKHTNN